MDSIKDIVSQVIENISLKKPEVQVKILRVWETILEEKDVKFTRIHELKEGKLIVNVDSPARLYQMNLKKRKILEALQEETADVKSLFFKIGKVT